MLKEYKDYIKDNPQGYWFKAKLYGWGWTPVRWQGWVVIAVFIALIIINANRIDSQLIAESDMLFDFIPQTLVLVILLILICYIKGEKPKWRWGIPKDKNK